MTTVWLNGELIFRSKVVLPPMKWIGMAKDMNMDLQNYTTAVFFEGASNERQRLVYV